MWGAREHKNAQLNVVHVHLDTVLSESKVLPRSICVPATFNDVSPFPTLIGANKHTPK